MESTSDVIADSMKDQRTGDLMVLQIQRELKLKKFIYRISNSDTYFGEANYTYGLLPRSIAIYQDYCSIMELKQTNWLLKLINSLPILSAETFTPFRYYENNTLWGKSKTRLFQPVFFFSIKENVYELRQHNHNIVSLMQNGVQIALYRKADFTELEKNEYEVKYRKDKTDKAPFLLLFCIFIDVVFYSNTSQVSVLKYEKDYVMKDPFPERARWEDDT